MARPAKPIAMSEGHRTSREISARTASENALKASEITVPERLTEEQKKIAEHIIRELHASEILCSLDAYVLEECCVAVICMQRINDEINRRTDAMYDKNLLSAKEKHEKTFFRCCDELCLSPQSRAKIAAANSAAKDDSLNAIKQALASAETDGEDDD